MSSRVTVCLMSNKSPNPNFSRQIWMLVFIGLIALPLNSLWVIDTGVTGHGVNFTRVSLFMNAICIIFVLSLTNPLLRRYAAKSSLTSRDMVLIYAMVCVSSAIGGHDIIQRMFPIIGYGFYFATPEKIGHNSSTATSLKRSSSQTERRCWAITRIANLFTITRSTSRNTSVRGLYRAWHGLVSFLPYWCVCLALTCWFASSGQFMRSWPIH